LLLPAAPDWADAGIAVIASAMADAIKARRACGKELGFGLDDFIAPALYAPGVAAPWEEGRLASPASFLEAV
jgi:hypothetical protein